MRKTTLEELGKIADASREDLWAAARRAGRNYPLIILHWSAGWYEQKFDDYHINITGDGEIWLSTEDLSEVLAHTWKLNRGTVGVSLCCAAGATTNDLGDAPPTEAQIEKMAQVIAVLCRELWLTIRPDIVMTHGEAGDSEELYDEEDLYGPQSGELERWDLEFLGTKESPEYNPWATDGSRGGDVLRGKAEWYRQEWKKGAAET